MSRIPSLFIGDTEIKAGSRVKLSLTSAKLYTDTEMSIPVEVIRAKRQGPTIFISAAIHGDELNGIEIVRRLLASDTFKLTRGTLIAVPMVNVYGMLTQSRYMPDRRDLNRSFPGSSKGSLTGRLANLFLTEIVSKCDYGIDLHTGAIHRSNLPQVRANLADEDTLSLAKAFGVPVLLNANLRDGSLRQAASESGTRILLYEAGEGLRFDEMAVRAGLAGILRVMRGQDMLPAKGIARVSNPLDVDVDTLGASGGSGGVYINNRGTGPLTVTGLTGNGGLALATGGDLDLNGDLQGRSVELAAGGDLTQRGRITGTDRVTVAGNGDVTMVSGAHTQSTGQVYYRAGQTLTVNSLHTTTGLPGGIVTLEARNLRSNATEPGSIRAGQVEARLAKADSERLYEMVDTTNGKARVFLNGRTLGGKIVEDAQFVADLTHPQSALPRVMLNPFEGFQPQTTGQGFQPVAGDNGEWHYNP